MGASVLIYVHTFKRLFNQALNDLVQVLLQEVVQRVEAALKCTALVWSNIIMRLWAYFARTLCGHNNHALISFLSGIERH